MVGPRSGKSRPVAFTSVDDNGFTLKGDPELMEDLALWAGQIVAELFRRCKVAKIGFARDKIHAIRFLRVCQGWRGPDVVFPDIVFDCPDMPEWHGFCLRVDKQLKLLGITLDKKMTWQAHVKACTQRAKKLLARLRVCVRTK